MRSITRPLDAARQRRTTPAPTESAERVHGARAHVAARRASRCAAPSRGRSRRARAPPAERVPVAAAVHVLGAEHADARLSRARLVRELDRPVLAAALAVRDQLMEEHAPCEPSRAPRAASPSTAASSRSRSAASRRRRPRRARSDSARTARSITSWRGHTVLVAIGTCARTDGRRRVRCGGLDRACASKVPHCEHHQPQPHHHRSAHRIVLPTTPVRGIT